MFAIPKEWVGETAVIFGGGPSLTKEQVDLAIAKGFRRVACNNAYVLDPQADVLTWCDPRWYLWKWDPLESTCRHASLSIL